ncbi:hypothetical protein S7335_4413 [Synechococcus sp. PCC 7335]|nr:hypothetical protein S7335_4413 [Synechococcus sp. PCC 7335]
MQQTKCSADLSQTVKGYLHMPSVSTKLNIVLTLQEMRIRYAFE